MNKRNKLFNSLVHKNGGIILLAPSVGKPVSSSRLHHCATWHCQRNVKFFEMSTRLA